MRKETWKLPNGRVLDIHTPTGWGRPPKGWKLLSAEEVQGTCDPFLYLKDKDYQDLRCMPFTADPRILEIFLTA